MDRYSMPNYVGNKGRSNILLAKVHVKTNSYRDK